MTDRQKAEEIASGLIARDEPITYSTLIKAMLEMAYYKDGESLKSLQRRVKYLSRRMLKRGYPIIKDSEIQSPATSSEVHSESTKRNIVLERLAGIDWKYVAHIAGIILTIAAVILIIALVIGDLKTTKQFY